MKEEEVNEVKINWKLLALIAAIILAILCYIAWSPVDMKLPQTTIEPIMQAPQFASKPTLPSTLISS